MFNQIASQKNPSPKPWPLPNFNPLHINDFDLTNSISRFLSITDGRKSALQGIRIIVVTTSLSMGINIPDIK